MSPLSLSGGSPQVLQCPGWQTSGEQELDAEDHGVTTPTLSSTPLKPAYVHVTPTVDFLSAASYLRSHGAFASSPAAPHLSVQRQHPEPEESVADPG